MDFTSWFLSKHWIISAILMPEWAFAWAVYMRWLDWAALVFVFMQRRRIKKAWDVWMRN